MAVEVLQPGLLTTVQDAGRTGHASEGWRSCGVCDPLAARVADLMAGNTGNTAVLELTGIGGSFRFTACTVAAFCGPDAVGTVNGRAVRAAFPLLMIPGDVLSVQLRDGLRAYIAVHGGFDVPAVMGSRSTDMACGTGGFEGRALRKGDLLPTVDCAPDAFFPRLHQRASRLTLLRPFVHPAARQPESAAVIRVIPGPQEDRFTDAGLHTFYSGYYTIRQDSNRMGLRLNGPAVEARGTTDILSDAIVYGSVQIASDGQPIIMLADHQTTGGYAKPATVIPADLPVLAQLRPGRRVVFRAVSLSEAAAAYRADADMREAVARALTE